MRFTVPSASSSREYLDTAAALTRTLLACLTTHSHDSTTSSSVCHGWFVLGIGGSHQSPPRGWAPPGAIALRPPPAAERPPVQHRRAGLAARRAPLAPLAPLPAPAPLTARAPLS